MAWVEKENHYWVGGSEVRDGPSSDFLGLVGYHAYEKKKNATRSGSFLPNSYYNIKLVLSYNFSEEKKYEFISNQIDKSSINDSFELITLHFYWSKIRKNYNIFSWSCSLSFRLLQRWYQNRDAANHLPFWIWSRKE